MAGCSRNASGASIRASAFAEGSIVVPHPHPEEARSTVSKDGVDRGMSQAAPSLILRRREAPSRRMGCTIAVRPSRRLLTQAPQDEVPGAMQQHEASSQLNDLASRPSTVTFNLPHPEEARSAVSKDGLLDRYASTYHLRLDLILRRREAPSRRMGCTIAVRPSRRLLTQAPQDEVRRAM
jgi:hypothetical protein